MIIAIVIADLINANNQIDLFLLFLLTNKQ